MSSLNSSDVRPNTLQISLECQWLPSGYLVLDFDASDRVSRLWLQLAQLLSNLRGGP